MEQSVPDCLHRSVLPVFPAAHKPDAARTLLSVRPYPLEKRNIPLRPSSFHDARLPEKGDGYHAPEECPKLGCFCQESARFLVYIAIEGEGSSVSPFSSSAYETQPVMLRMHFRQIWHAFPPVLPHPDDLKPAFQKSLASLVQCQKSALTESGPGTQGFFVSPICFLSVDMKESIPCVIHACILPAVFLSSCLPNVPVKDSTTFYQNSCSSCTPQRTRRLCLPALCPWLWRHFCHHCRHQSPFSHAAAGALLIRGRRTGTRALPALRKENFPDSP